MTGAVSPVLDPKTGQPVDLYPNTSFGGMLRVGIDDPEGLGRLTDNRFQSIVRGSALAVADRGYRQAFTDPNVGTAGKAGYVAGRLIHDIVNDGSRVPWWVLNHPMAQAAVLSDVAADAAGLNPDYGAYEQLRAARGDEISRPAIDEEFAKEYMGFSFRGEGAGIPLGLARKVPAVIASSALLATSGNSNFANITGGGRQPGFESILPVEGDKTQSSNPLSELGIRYMFGRTGRLLPWEEFTTERPDVSPTDYGSYRAYQFDSGPLMGIAKATSRNIDAEPELGMLGFRVPLSAASTVGGTLIGGIAGAKALDAMVNEQMQNRFGGALKARGNRRLAGYALGALAGGIAGRAGSQVINDAIIQPTLNPEAVAAAAQWHAEQQAKGLL
jgi:hypothetical protein